MFGWFKRKRYKYIFECWSDGLNFTITLNLDRCIESNDDIVKIERFIAMHRSEKYVEVLDYMYVCRV